MKSNASPLRIAVILALLLPLFNALVFRGLGLFFLTEPLKYPAGLSQTLGFIYETLSTLFSFLAPLCLMYAIIARRQVAGTVSVCALSVPSVYAIMILEDVMINSITLGSDDIKSAIIDTSIVYLIYVLVILAAYFVRSAKKNAPREIELFSLRGSISCGIVVCTVLTFMAVAVQQGLETYVMVKVYGAPETASEVMELVTPYIVVTVCAIVAYIAGCLIIARAGCSHKSRKRRR